MTHTKYLTIILPFSSLTRTAAGGGRPLAPTQRASRLGRRLFGLVAPLLVGLVPWPALAQPEFTWAKQGRGTNHDVAMAVAADRLGNSYITGQSQSPTISFGGITLTNRGSNGIVVAKLSSTGDAIWARSFGQVSPGANPSRGQGAAADTNGNCFITGVFSGTVGFGDTNLSSAGLADVFVAKFDPSGNLLWVQTGGGPGLTNRSLVSRIVADSSGNIGVASDFLSTIQLTSAAGTNATLSGGGAFLAKYDTGGNLLWVRQMSGDTYPDDLAADAAGNVYFAGDFGDPNITVSGTALTNRGLVNGFVAKFSGQGNLLWTRQVGGSDRDWPSGLAADMSGNVYLACNVNSTDVTINGTPFTEGGHLLAKFNSSGSLVWAKGTPLMGRIAVDQSGQVVMAREFDSMVTFGSHTLTNSGGSQDIFVAKFDPSGNPLWAKRAGGVNQDVAWDVALDDQADIYVAGEFQGLAAFDTLSLTNTSLGSGDVFVARINGGPPVLGIHLFANQVRITWPASTVGYHLEGTPVLAAGMWQNVTNVPEIVEADFAVTLTSPSGNSFFRLKSP